jgi:hypothetical protein
MSSPVRRTLALVCAAMPLTVVAAIVVVFLPLSPSYDLEVFLRAGQATLHGLPLYPRLGSPAVYSGGSFVYPFFAVWPFVALAAIPSSASTAVFFVVCVGAVLVACGAGAGRDPWPATLVLCSAFTITGLQLGALSPLLFAGAVFLWRLRERPLALALLAGPVLASKLFLAPLLLWLLVARRYRALTYAGLSTLTLLALSFALGPIGPLQYLHLLSQLGAHEARAGFGLIGALMNVGLRPAAAQAAALALTLALLAAAYAHYRRRSDERVAFCAGIVVSLVLTPVLWSHYLILLAAALMTLGAPRRWLVTFALASWAIAPPHGVHVDTDLIEGVTSSGPWFAVGASMLVFAYAAARPAGSATEKPPANASRSETPA